MTAKHTPGPWSVASKCEVNGASGVWVADCGFWRDEIDGWIEAPESEANARLIAAAPEMLEALWQYESDLMHPPTGDSLERRLARVRSVIAKATGDAS